MSSAFGKLLDALADLLGLSSNKSPRQQPRAPRPDGQFSSAPPARPEQDGAPAPTTFDGTLIQPGGCHACGVRPAEQAYENLFCSRECQRRWNFDVAEYREERERQLADAMDACHDRMEEIHGDN